MSEARLTVSMDLELGWGAISNGRWRARQAAGVYDRLRPAMARLIAELDAARMPLTWAAVGALAGPAPRADHLPGWRAREIESFAGAPGAARDGRDLLDLIARAKTPHEIASHGMTHTRFDAPGLTDAGRRAEIALAARALAPWAGPPVCLVFPENAVDGLGAVAAAGIRAARTAPTGWEEGGLRARLGRPPMSETRQCAGLRLVSGSLFLHWPPRDPGGLRRALTLWRAERALRHALRQGGDVHLWLHPFNLSEVPGLLDAVICLVRRAAAHRDAGRLTLLTMGQAALGTRRERAIA